ncbi:MAG: BTAD domain-containing putative transcriptional regulator [Ornithinibacter sp.]
MSQIVLSEIGEISEHSATHSMEGDAGPAPDPADRIEVRLLGPLQVRRADGSLVLPHEWRTGKTVDLLRLLATGAGRAVSVDEILEALWPEVDPHRGRGSLRNALGHLRKLLGQGAIERRPDGLVLRGAWVDSTALLALADEARRHARHGRLALAVKLAREADALHLGEFTTHDPNALWAVPIRENLESRFREMTLDAAEHAVELGWMRDGLELGQRALDADVTSERAYRVLMRAYTGLGETERALRVYERCRAVLAEDLGLDPSPQTRALHLEILSSEPQEAPPAPFTGRARELRQLVDWLSEQRSTGGSGLVYVSGPEGSGRTRLVHEAAERLRARVDAVGASDDPVAAVAAAAESARRAAGGPSGGDGSSGVRPRTILLVTATAHLSAPARRALLAALDAADGAVTVALRLSENARAAQAHDVSDPTSDADASTGADRTPHATSTLAVDLLPLTPAALERLAAAQLCGTPSPTLLDELARRSEGVPGRALATIDAWSRAGEVAATSQGLALVPPHDSSNHSAEQSTLLVRAMEQTSARDQHVLHLVALLDRPVNPALLMPLLRAPAPAAGDAVAEDVAVVVASLDRLVDLQLLASTPDGYVVRDPFLRHAVESWLRPSVRRRLHAHIAERARIPAAERGRHWRAAGEVELATAAAFDAVRDAMANGDVSDARRQLLVVNDLAVGSHALNADLAELEESLADVCLAAGRVDEAVQHYGRAADWLEDSDATAAQRLRDKAARAQRALAPAAHDAQPEPVSAPPPVVPPEPDDEERERSAWAAVRDADAAGPLAQRIDARCRLVREHLLPARRLPRFREVTAEAIALAADGPSRADAVALHHLPDVLLGNARLAEHALDAAWGASDPDRPEMAHLAVLRCLVGHDLGRRGFDTRWEHAMRLAPPGSESVEWTWARVRMLTERGSLAEAIEEDRRPVRPGTSTLGRQLRALSTSGLLAALGRPAEALRVLREAMAEAEEEGCSLLLPEVTARMVVLTAPTDPAEAIGLFELFDWAAGSEIGHAREGYLRLLARAAVRGGNEELDRAAAAAANAARIAQDSGLVLLASEAYLAQAQYLFEGGWSAGARVATAGAARCLRAAGTVG